MKYTYNLENFNFKVGEGEGSIGQASLDIKGVAVTVEFSVEELAAVAQATLAMRNAAIDAFQKIAPIVKDAIIEIGKVGSDEIARHRNLDEELSAKRQARQNDVQHEFAMH